MAAATITLPKAKSERLHLEAEEPAVYRVLDLLCYNEQVRAQYPIDTDPASIPLAKIPWYMRWTADFFRYPNAGHKAFADSQDRSS
jgi:hypothetical protein